MSRGSCPRCKGEGHHWTFSHTTYRGVCASLAASFLGAFVCSGVLYGGISWKQQNLLIQLAGAVGLLFALFGIRTLRSLATCCPACRGTGKHRSSQVSGYTRFPQ